MTNYHLLQSQKLYYHAGLLSLSQSSRTLSLDLGRVETKVEMRWQPHVDFHRFYFTAQSHRFSQFHQHYECEEPLCNIRRQLPSDRLFFPLTNGLHKRWWVCAAPTDITSCAVTSNLSLIHINFTHLKCQEFLPVQKSSANQSSCRTFISVSVGFGCQEGEKKIHPIFVYLKSIHPEASIIGNENTLVNPLANTH